MSAKEIMEVLKFVIPLAWVSFEEYKPDIFLLFVSIILNVSTILHGCNTWSIWTDFCFARNKSQMQSSKSPPNFFKHIKWPLSFSQLFETH